MLLTNEDREELPYGITDEQWKNICKIYEELERDRPLDIYEEFEEDFIEWVKENCHWRPLNRYEQLDMCGNKMFYPESHKKWEQRRDFLYKEYGLSLTGGVIED